MDVTAVATAFVGIIGVAMVLSLLFNPNSSFAQAITATSGLITGSINAAKAIPH